MIKIPKVILLIKPEGAFDRRLLLGIAKYAHLHGPWAIFHEVEQRKRNPRTFKNLGANGIIADIRETPKMVSLFGLDIPIITIGNPALDDSIFPNIISNADMISKMGAEHFFERGFKHFGFCNYQDFYWSVHRAGAFEFYVNRAGFDCDIYHRISSQEQLSWEKEQRLLMKWLQALSKPVAIMACNDDFGRQVLEACKLGNIAVPEEVAVLGVDNDEIICNLTDPPLSSVHLNTEKAGYEAAELLERLMHGENMSGQMVITEPTHIEVRKSTDILAIEDVEVAEAMRFINKNFRFPIQVENVAEAIGLSRRCLSTRFKKAIGSTINCEISKTRIKHIKFMLSDTRLSIGEIASKFGFQGIEKLSRFFYRETGMTPTEYRKKNT